MPYPLPAYELFNGKYTEDFRQKTETKQKKKLATLHQVVFQVEFSLLLAFLGPLEEVRGISLQYPTTQEEVYFCNGAVSEKPSLSVEYVISFSG